MPAVVNAIVQNADKPAAPAHACWWRQSAYERVLDAVGTRIAALRVGPAALDLDVGPLIRSNQLQRVQDFLADAAASSMRTVAQGNIVAGSAHWLCRSAYADC